MRRYTFYLSVALLAFGIGSFVVFNLYFKHAEQSVIAQTTEINKSEVKEQALTSTQDVPQDKELNDEEKAAFDVLKPTIKKWLRGEKIKSEFTDASNESIKEISGKDKSELSEDEATWYSYFRFEPTLIDIDGDGKNELAIRNYCAPVGNCQFWVFKKKGNDYEILLQSDGGDVQTFKLEHKKSKGYFDIKTTSHGDAWSGGIEVYKFNGKKYTLGECYEYNYSYLKDGKLYELKKAKITSRKCDE
ncbi:MAG: hypothetical protein M3033_02125 [Acidobacteriota bacterium]|nr:hypothetical protein [Acidobacteriota bacterium]